MMVTHLLLVADSYTSFELVARQMIALPSGEYSVIAKREIIPCREKCMKRLAVNYSLDKARCG